MKYLPIVLREFFLTLATGWGFIQSGQISIPPDLAGFVEHCQLKVLFVFEVIVKSPFGDFRRLHDVPLAGERIEVRGGQIRDSNLVVFR